MSVTDPDTEHLLQQCSSTLTTLSPAARLPSFFQRLTLSEVSGECSVMVGQ